MVIMTEFKLILFDKYLIRADEYCWILAMVKDDKPPVVTKKKKEKKDGTTTMINDYSNFNDKAYYGSFSHALQGIKDRELKESNINTLDDLIHKLNEIDNKINKIKEKFL